MIISRKRFEEMVYKRLEEERDRMEQRRAVEMFRQEMYGELHRLETHIARLEEIIMQAERKKEVENV